MIGPGLTDSLITSLGQGVRRAYPIVVYQGSDVSNTFGPSLMALTYKEGFGYHQLADTMEIDLADPEGLFRKSWSLNTGQSVSASIVMENWNGAGTGTLTKDLGSMEIKSVRIEQNKHSGTTVKLSCTSIPVNIGMRLEKKSRAWTQTTVQDVVNQIAADNGLTPRYTPSKNPKMERVDQHDHSDAFMLRKIGSENDFSSKVVNKNLWVRDVREVETSTAVGTIICPTPGNPGGLNNCGIIRWEFVETTEDANYSEADLKYKDHTTGDTSEGNAKDPNQTGLGPKLVYHYDPHTGALRSTQGITLD